jgi:hypothetical protein
VAIVETQHVRPRGSRLAVVAGLIGIAVDVGYLAIIFDEAERTSGRVLVVFSFIFVMSALALVGGSGLTTSVRTTAIVLGAATGGFLTAGVLGIFSIGLPLLIAGVMCAVACAGAARSAHPVPPGVPILSTVAAIASGALLMLGIAIT